MDEIQRAKHSTKLLRGNILPRLRLITFHYNFWVSFGFSALLALGIHRFPISRMEVSDLAGIGLSFASISLGACFTTAVLTLSLPGNDRIKKWSTVRGEIPNSSSLSDLLFVIVWAAIAQIGLIITCASALVVGGDLQVFPDSAPTWQRLSVLLCAWIFLYALSELLVVVSTLNKVGAVIIFEEREKALR